MWLIGLLVAVVFRIQHLNAHDSTTYDHHAVLDANNKYEMWWKFDDDTITFKVKVATKGWIGWGLSPSGKMAGSDMVIAWVDDTTEQVYFDDRHARGHYLPAKDLVGNYNMLTLKQDNGTTIMEFSRKLKLCNDQDLDISSDTSRVLYAWGDDDPVSKQISYHSKRGVKSIYLLDYVDPKLAAAASMQGRSLDSYNTTDLRMTGYTIEVKPTIYKCETFKLPASNKRQIFRIDPIITPGNEGIVHHILLYSCIFSNAGFDSHLNKVHDCISQNMPRELQRCRTTIFAGWAIGGGNFYYPKDVGMPLYSTTMPQYFLLEIHYDNPSLVQRLDKSGFRIYHVAPTLKYDAGLVVAGSLFGLHKFVIPQKQKNFVQYGTCSSRCLPAKASESTKIFALFLHGHIFARSIVVRLVRDSDGVETKRILQDLNYDFNFQETRYLKEPIDIPPGHSIQVECGYNTQNTEKPVGSGWSTQEEMCCAFLYTYPRLNLRSCLSGPANTFYWTVAELDWKWNSDVTKGLLPVTVKGKTINETDAVKVLAMKEIWENNQTLVDSYQRSLETSQIVRLCSYTDYKKSPKYAPYDITDPVRKVVALKDEGVCHSGGGFRPSLSISVLVLTIVASLRMSV